jgi:hypothetical protein
MPGTFVASPAAIETRAPNARRSRRARPPRTPYRVPCRVRFFNEVTGTERTLCGQTANLSAAGIAVQLGVPVHDGAWIEVLVPRLTGESLCVAGTAIHCRKVLTGTYEIGITLHTERPVT